MSIQRVHLEEFQSHKDSTLEFSDGMNVIWGSTDSGKSSIIRLIRWIVLNRPLGDEFRRHGTKKTQGTIETDNFIVQRRKTDSKNEYEMDEDIFKALRSNVPEDISSALNLSEANIQSQHEVYFLVNKPPGQRSKELNEVAGLEIMDKVSKNVNSEIRTNNSKIGTEKSKLKDSKDKIKQLKWVKKADSFLHKLETYQEKIEAEEERYTIVNGIIEKIETLEARMEFFMSDKCIEAIKKLMRDKKVLEDLESKKAKISRITTSIENLENDLESIVLLDTSELEKTHNTILNLEEKYNRISELVKDIESKELQHKQIYEMNNQTNIKIKAELRRLGKCPLCGGNPCR